MPDNRTGHGHCLCQKVKVTVNIMNHKMGTCHCSMCRKWGGGPLMSVDCGTDVKFEGEENINAYDSSDWAQRGFCNQCGSHLFYKLKEKGIYIIPVGIFDSEIQFEFEHQIFIEQKPEYYEFANKTHNMTGEEVFAQYASE